MHERVLKFLVTVHMTNQRWLPESCPAPLHTGEWQPLGLYTCRCSICGLVPLQRAHAEAALTFQRLIYMKMQSSASLFIFTFTCNKLNSALLISVDEINSDLFFFFFPRKPTSFGYFSIFKRKLFQSFDTNGFNEFKANITFNKNTGRELLVCELLEKKCVLLTS